MTALLFMLATAVPLLAVLKVRDLWRSYRPPARGKYSTIFGPGGRVIMVENKSLRWVLTGRG